MDSQSLKNKELQELEIIRHSSAHLLAQAVQRLFKATKAIGPVTQDGFFYDLDLDHKISEQDFEMIEKEMKKIVKENLKIERKVISKADAINLFKDLNEPYKVEILEGIEDNEVTIYRQGEFTDLCRGPHVPYTSQLKAFKLKAISGAYWRNDKSKKMLQRVYGYAFKTKDDLEKHLEFMKEVEKRDHRRLGRELNLFISAKESFGATFWLPKGMVLRRIVESYSREEHLKEDYLEVKTPTIMNRCLWEQSGHWENYRDNMYTTEAESEVFAIKPMNCPGAALLFKSSPKSYRDFPLKFYEIGTVFRKELSGTIHGLMRQREFTQDDSHLFITAEMIENEVLKIAKLIDRIFDKFQFKYEVMLSTRPDKYMGSLDTWNGAETSLKRALDRANLEYTINAGDGAFYGPKIDYQIKDAIGRKWQCSTIQLDFNLPERFDLEYIDSDGSKKRPIMLHRAIYGSIERFIGILTEHYSGNFPLFLAPVQARILTISEKSEAYAKEVFNLLKNNKIRAELDSSAERISHKIRVASLDKIPLQIVVGEDERDKSEVNIRQSNLSNNIKLDDLVKYISSLI